MKTPLIRLCMAGAVGFALLGGCNRDADVETDNTVPPTTEVPSQAIRVTEVDLGRSVSTDGRINDNMETDEFRPADTIYASVATDGTASGSALSARWTFEDGQVVDESSQNISPTGPAITEFHISKPNGFPKGKYKVEIKLNGQTVETKDFEVK
jgi:hypothetical protein